MTAATDFKIHIVGGPGSGKSVLGSRLACRAGTRVWCLDDLALADGVHPDFRPRRALADRKRELEQISATSSWISEGSYLWWTHLLFERADVIIWLDPPWRLAARRILIRHVRAYWNDVRRGQDLKARLRALRYPHVADLVSFFRWSSRYYKTAEAPDSSQDPDDMRALTRSATRSYLSAHDSKVVHLTAPGLEPALAALAARNWRFSADPIAAMPREAEARLR